MAVTFVTMACVCLTACLVVAVASPTSRQYSPETSSSGPSAEVTSDGEVWDEADEFDLDGEDEDWLGEPPAASPSSTLPLRAEYEDYDDDDDVSPPKRGDEDNDVEVQEAEEDEDDESTRRNSAEFLFLPSTDRRLVLQDDDADQSGIIKVRHTRKNPYPDVESNSLEEDAPKDEDDDQFEFTLGDDDDEDDKSEDLEKDDFVLEDTRGEESKGEIPRPATRDDEDDNGDDDEDEKMFESPEEDSQVIYGDHVFLY